MSKFGFMLKSSARTFVFFTIALGVCVSSVLPAAYGQSPLPEAVVCAPPKRPPTVEYKVTLASTVAQVAPVEWGIEAGCFKKYGLDVSWSVVPSSTIAIAGMVGGTYDLVIATPTNLVLAQGNGGVNFKIIAPRHIYSAAELTRAQHKPFYQNGLLLQTALLTLEDSKIENWADLSGKKIGVQSLVGGDSAGILLAMKSVGASSSSTQFISLSTSQMESSLTRGNVDAVVASEPYASSIVEHGGKVIGYPVSYFQEAGPTVVYASIDKIVSARRPAFVAFKKAILEINRLQNLPQNEVSIKTVMAKVTSVDVSSLDTLKLPVMGETQVKFIDLAYIPRKLKAVGFLVKRVDITPILDW